MRVRYTEAALGDVEQIFRYLAARNPAAAARVVERVEQLAARLAVFPELGHPTDEAGVRIVPVGRFPYLIFYTAGSDVTVLHVRHAARLPP